jgi:hypothetical protein
MRFTLRLIAFALWSCCLSALPSHASQDSSAHLEGVKCQLPTNHDADNGNQPPGYELCQIVDDGGPILTLPPFCSATNGTCLVTEILLQALSTLENAHRNSSTSHHPTAPPPPTP